MESMCAEAFIYLSFFSQCHFAVFASDFELPFDVSVAA